MSPNPQQVEDLHRDLSRIHEELAHAERLDPDTRALLERTVADIRAALARAEPAPPEAGDEDVGPFREALERLAVTLERSNPRLAAGVNQLSQTLSNMGI